MTVEQALLETVRALPSDQQQEVLDFAEFLRQTRPQRAAGARRNPIGLLADLQVDISETDIAAARQELWGNFPRPVDL